MVRDTRVDIGIRDASGPHGDDAEVAASCGDPSSSTERALEAAVLPPPRALMADASLSSDDDPWALDTALEAPPFADEATQEAGAWARGADATERSGATLLAPATTGELAPADLDGARGHSVDGEPTLEEGSVPSARPSKE